MKILFLGFTKIKFMPYLSFYIDQINCSKNDIHIVYWNRDLKVEDLSNFKDVNLYEYRAHMEDSIAKFDKIKFFYGYRKFVKNILRENKFDLIVSLHTLPGLCLFDKLIAKYRYKYILDYRDSTFEENFCFGFLVKQFAYKSKAVFTSSDAFRRFLPVNDIQIFTTHNLLSDSLNYRNIRDTDFIPSNKIRVSYWGLIRNYHHNLKIINSLANDPRFELHYYGRAQSLGDDMVAYIEKNNIRNVFLHGEYKPEDRYKFVLCTDIIHNSFSDANMQLAMSNKYYDGVIFYIPQVCMHGSYMGKRCIDTGVGIELDPSDVYYADKLYEYYKSLDLCKFKTNCDKELKRILEEYSQSNSVVKNLFEAL